MCNDLQTFPYCRMLLQDNFAVSPYLWPVFLFPGDQKIEKINDGSQQEFNRSINEFILPFRQSFLPTQMI